jgi:penicillin-binding protein 1A
MASNRKASQSSKSPKGKRQLTPARIALGTLGVIVSLGVIGALILAFMLAMAYPNLPKLDSLTDYRPKIPLRIYTADSILIGEFGEERRNVIRFKDVPDIMKQAILSIEDDRFYEHHGVDYAGIVRAALHNLSGGAKQGASTITQQVARNFFLSSEQTLKRKIYEIMLAWKIEQNLTKDQIFEVYLNQIYLGQRAYGFASASQIYFGKKLQDISLAEAAMLAGLPKAPSAYNPVANPKRAKARQQYILQRMHLLGYINDEELEEAKNEELRIKTDSTEFGAHAEYVAEMTRQLVYEQFKEETYTRGLNVYTTITKADQDAAYIAVRRGVMAYERRHGYRGPEGYMTIPSDSEEAENAIEVELVDHPESDGIVAAVVLEASPKEIRAMLPSGEEIEITGNGLKFAANLLSAKAPPQKRVKRGAIIRVIQDGDAWSVTQMPEVEAAFVAANTDDGAIRALIGGFDFNRNKFNHVTQAWRQPGSAFKPFIYSASLEKGLSPATMVNDAPLVFNADHTGGQSWEPKNYDGKFEGPMTVRRALTKSKNMVSIRILQSVGPKFGQEHATRFGFEANRNPSYLTLALGAGAVTPLQMAGAYAVFANGGYRVSPYIISKITDASGRVLSRVQPELAGDEANRVIDARNAFLMDNMMKDVVKQGTATRALSLKRPDVAGKTGTTNDSIDAWFAGYHPKIVAIAWVGFDQPKNLGNKETGGAVALPIWIDYMEKALKDVPVVEREVPEGILAANSDFFYVENRPGYGISGLGIGDTGLPSDGLAQDSQTRDEVMNELF